MSDLNCPYCEEACREPDECYDEDYPYECECEHCEKNFIFYVSYTKNFDAQKCPCLNGEEHLWRKSTGFPEEYYKNTYRCVHCDTEEKFETPPKNLKETK